MPSPSLSLSQLYHLPFGTAFGMTDVGLVRSGNEDGFLVDEECGLVMVADGMGGHDGGEVASAGALTAVWEFLTTVSREKTLPSNGQPDGDELTAPPYDPDATWADETIPAVGVVYDAIEFANAILFKENVLRAHDDGSGMGTTLTGLWRPAADGPLIVFQVGDSRLYRYRNGELTLLTHDQTLYQQAVDAGMVEALPNRNMLLQAVGPSRHVKPAIGISALQPGDIFLLCSDGLHGSVAHSEMEAVAARVEREPIETCCNALIDLAKADGGHDNITVVFVKA